MNDINPRSTVASEGDTVDTLKLEKLLGTPGEQGEVWLATVVKQPALKYAVKISSFPLLPGHKEAYDRFVKEFDTIAKMQHPNIVRGYWEGKFRKCDKEYPYYVMEYLGEGTAPLTNSEFLKAPSRRRYLCLKAFFDVASALKHLHIDKHGHHLDLKASNILVQPRPLGLVKITLIDFGFADLLAEQGKSSPAAAAGRSASKLTSLHRTIPAESTQHLDLWQLCFTVKTLLDECKTSPENDDHAYWPIDYALYGVTYDLITRWASEAQSSAPNNGTIDSFYKEVDRLKESFDTDNLGADIRASTWYISIPEIATIAKIATADHAIRIPQRQLVLYTDRIKQVLASSALTQLGYTRQLGFTHLVYPGAQGTRFEHSIGVFDLACHFILRMSGRPEFRRLCRSPKDALLFILAALLHDVGHYPYAHQLEEFLVSDFPSAQQPLLGKLVGKENGHKAHGRLMLLEGELNRLLRSSFSLTVGDITRLSQFIEQSDTEDSPDATLMFLRSVLNGPMDLDKLDYIERDANHCGVPYGSYVDTDRIFETMRVYEDNGKTVLAFDERGVGPLEQLAIARHQLYTNVYWHRAVRAATAMFKHLFYLTHQVLPTPAQLQDIFYNAGSDDRLLLDLKTRLEAPDVNQNDQRVRAALHLGEVVSGRKRALYKAIIQRKYDSTIAQKYGESYYIRQREIANTIYQGLLTDGMWLPDATALGEHNILIDCRFDSWPLFETINVLKTKGGKPGKLGSFSPLVTRLNDTFREQACKIRVFVNVDVLKPEFQTKIGRANVELSVRKAISDFGE
jgi:HD superfamily phosphohydrolase